MLPGASSLSLSSVFALFSPVISLLFDAPRPLSSHILYLQFVLPSLLPSPSKETYRPEVTEQDRENEREKRETYMYKPRDRR